MEGEEEAELWEGEDGEESSGALTSGNSVGVLKATQTHSTCDCLHVTWGKEGKKGGKEGGKHGGRKEEEARKGTNWEKVFRGGGRCKRQMGKYAHSARVQVWYYKIN